MCAGKKVTIYLVTIHILTLITYSSCIRAPIYVYIETNLDTCNNVVCDASRHIIQANVTKNMLGFAGKNIKYVYAA